MIKNLHKWLILRLTIVWLVLSLVSGLLVHYLGHAQLYEHIDNMAKTESATFEAGFMEYLQAPYDQALVLLKQRLDTAIEKNNFVALRLYDNNLKIIAEASKSSAGEIEAKFGWPTEASVPPTDIAGKRLVVNSETYVTVSFPFDIDKQGGSGRLDGIYQAPREVLAGLRHQSYGSVSLVVVTILLTSIVLYPIIIRLNSQLIKYSNILALTNVGMLKVLGSAIAKRDSDTNIHNYRVTLYSVRLGEKLGISPIAMQGLIKGAFLHDVGKIAISDRILLKPGKLTDEEFGIMKTHVEHGEDIISGYAWLTDAGDVVRCHHEKFDGSGYPNRIIGNDIPQNARIFAIADVFDAITSRRSYKEALTLDDAVEIIRQSQGNHLDPAVVPLFLDHAERLYGEIYIEDETRLHKKLQEIIVTYFDQKAI